MPKKSAKKVKRAKRTTTSAAATAKKKLRRATTRSKATKATKGRRTVAKKVAPKRPKVSPKKVPPRAKPRRAASSAQGSPTTSRAKNATPGGRVRRRDGAGHIEPKYAAELLAQSGGHKNDGGAFLSRSRSRDDLAEELGEDFVHTATSGEAGGEEVLDQVVPEELGGPFVTSTGGTEFAEGTDESNPEDAEREPFPTT